MFHFFYKENVSIFSAKTSNSEAKMDAESIFKAICKNQAKTDDATENKQKSDWISHKDCEVSFYFSKKYNPFSF
jgi:hypothetical protein